MGEQVNKLSFVHADFLRPPKINPFESVHFARVAETMDLWHHRMGHIGETATKNLLKSVNGVSFPPGDKLSKCEPCIIGKHSRAPHPLSPTPKSTELLELVFCDLCGPFPVMTPHGKLYLITFLDDCSDALKVHCLARKDQSYDAWKITKASWEQKTGKKVKRF